MYKQTAISITFGVLVLTFGVGFYAYALFTPPVDPPPICDTGDAGCDPPLHAGGDGQSKGGNLVLNTDSLLANGLVVWSGNVGIGEPSPAEALDVVGNIVATGTICGSAGCVSGGVAADSIGDLELANGFTWNITSALRIDKSSSGEIASFLGGANDSSYEWVGFYSGSTRQGIILYDGSWSGCSSVVDEVCLKAENGNHLSLYSAGGGGDHIRLMPGSGNVGIGTTGPTLKLDVNGKIRMRTVTTGGDAADTVATKGYVDAAAGGAGVPSGAVMYFNLASCPSGWTELTSARGRYVVGKPSGGTLAGIAGTALSNLENRAVGQHSHGVTDPGHFHTIDTVDTTGSGVIQEAIFPGGLSANTNTAVTGITISNAGSVAGTNAPYIQLLACQKT